MTGILEKRDIITRNDNKSIYSSCQFYIEICNKTSSRYYRRGGGATIVCCSLGGGVGFVKWRMLSIRDSKWCKILQLLKQCLIIFGCLVCTTYTSYILYTRNFCNVPSARIPPPWFLSGEGEGSNGDGCWKWVI